MSKATKTSRKTSSKGKGKGRKSTKADRKPQVASGSDRKPTETPTLDNCYRARGGYWAAIQALRSLGLGKMHDHSAILPAIKKAMGADWKEFASKKGKLTADERAMMNLMVTSRKDYGRPVIECGYEVRWEGRGKKAGLFKIGK